MRVTRSTRDSTQLNSNTSKIRQMKKMIMRRKGTKVVVRDACSDKYGKTGTVVGYDAEQAAITVRFSDGEEQSYDYLALDPAPQRRAERQ